jgi:ubiquitin C-terminal hydrolase
MLLDSLKMLNTEEIPHLALVNAQGKLCSRCIFNSHCHGCIKILPNDDTNVLLQVNDTIAITYTQLTIEDLEMANSATCHESLTRPKIKDRLSLDDCLEAFSRTEELDESNPWYCPICTKNQCATKTLSVWRFPDYLILYLKRYSFHIFEWE